MDNQVLEELKELRLAVSKLAGTSKLQPDEQFSLESLDKAGIEFKNLTSKRDEWITEYDLDKYFKDARYGVGKFIRDEFAFSNYFRKGVKFYYNKAAITALAKELKARNVKLSRYIELRQDRERFLKKVASATIVTTADKKTKLYKLPANLHNVNTMPPKPDIEAVKADIDTLINEFNDGSLDEYIDIYTGDFAMISFDYHFSQYFDNKLKLKCKKWCDRFNYASHALKLLTGKAPTFLSKIKQK